MDRTIISESTAFTFSPIVIDGRQLYVTAAAADKDADQLLICQEIYQKVAELLLQEKMQIVQERLFCSMNIYADVLKVRRSVMHSHGIKDEYPVTVVQGRPLWGEGFAGVQICAVKSSGPGNKVWTIYDQETPCGRGWKSDGATYLLIQNLHGLETGLLDKGCREEQSIRMFERADKLLREQGADYRNVIRTWIYISHILGWYKAFNKIRNEKYREFGVIPSDTNGLTTEKIYLPASTGIEGENIFGAASVMDLLAVKTEPGSNIEIIQNTGCMQQSPYRYGSAFSRSMIIRSPKCDLHHVSGTASIDEQGKSLYANDTLEQIRHTFGVVDTMIQKEGASLQHICQATVFLKNKEDYPLYRSVIEHYGLTGMPAVCVIADICRDDLLFELDAVVAKEKNDASRDLQKM